MLSHDHNDTAVARVKDALQLHVQPTLGYKRRAFAWRDLPCIQDTNEAVSAYIACWTEAHPLVQKKNTSLDDMLVLSSSADPLKIAERQSLRIDAHTSHAATEAVQWRVVARCEPLASTAAAAAREPLSSSTWR